MPERRPKILIVDDQEIVRKGFLDILSLENRFNLIEPVASGEEALNAMVRDTPDVCLLDVRMPGIDGVETVRRLNEDGRRNVKVIHLTMYNDIRTVARALLNGVEGFLLKDVSRRRLIASIDVVLNGGVVFDRDVAALLSARNLERRNSDGFEQTSVDGALTEREIDVVRLICAGYSNRSIASKLDLSEGTVRNYVSAILSKLHVTSRTQIVLAAIQTGIA